MVNEMDVLKDNIRQLIELDKMEAADNLIKQFLQIMPQNPTAIALKAQIELKNNQMGQAEKLIEKGMLIEANNFEIWYAKTLFAMLDKDNKQAIEFAKKASECVKTDSDLKIMRVLIEKISLLEVTEQKKICFFCKENMDSFLTDIVNRLSVNYDVQKVIIKNGDNSQLLDKYMQWADICWFEWCDDLIAYASNTILARTKKIICRVHSYEVFTDMPLKVNWANIDKVICVAESIQSILIQNHKISPEQSLIIPNGIEPEAWKFRERGKGFKIAYVGYINYKKGPMLLLQVFKAIVDQDSRYTLHIAGKFQDGRDILYFNQMIAEMKLEKNLFFEEWQNDLDQWLEDKNYILCTSILESQNISVMQAMAKGIKPIIHNFVGARNIYPARYIWNTIPEALVKIGEKNYNSTAYRDFITQNYSLNEQIGKITEAIEQLFLESKADEIESKIIQFKYGTEEVKFYLPMLNDFIQSVIYGNGNFYEVGMLEDIRKRIGEGKVIVDIGANIGNHSVYFSKICKAKKVYSFEPQKNIFNILKKNVEINAMENVVTCFNMGVGKEHTYANIEVVNENNYGMSRVDIKTDGQIEIDSLDNILKEKVSQVDMLKIDVEGMEIDVLEGAAKILKNHRPLIYIEAGTEKEFEEVSLYLKKYRYLPLMQFNATPTYLFVPEKQ